LAYIYLAWDCWQSLKWPFRKLVLAVIAAFVPFGPFWFHAWFERT